MVSGNHLVGLNIPCGKNTFHNLPFPEWHTSVKSFNSHASIIFPEEMTDDHHGGRTKALHL